MSQALHLNVHRFFDLLILIQVVLKTPLVGFTSSFEFLSVMSGKSLSLSILSVNTFCVASGNLPVGEVPVASGTSKCGGGMFGILGLFGSFTGSVVLLSFVRALLGLEDKNCYVFVCNLRTSYCCSNNIGTIKSIVQLFRVAVLPL